MQQSIEKFNEPSIKLKKGQKFDLQSEKINIFKEIHYVIRSLNFYFFNYT